MQGKKIDHNGVKIELLGQIGSYLTNLSDSLMCYMSGKSQWKKTKGRSRMSCCLKIFCQYYTK